MWESPVAGVWVCVWGGSTKEPTERDRQTQATFGQRKGDRAGGREGEAGHGGRGGRGWSVVHQHLPNWWHRYVNSSTGSVVCHSRPLPASHFSYARIEKENSLVSSAAEGRASFNRVHFHRVEDFLTANPLLLSTVHHFTWTDCENTGIDASNQTYHLKHLFLSVVIEGARDTITLFHVTEQRAVSQKQTTCRARVCCAPWGLRCGYQTFTTLSFRCLHAEYLFEEQEAYLSLLYTEHEMDFLGFTCNSCMLCLGG